MSSAKKKEDEEKLPSNGDCAKNGNFKSAGKQDQIPGESFHVHVRLGNLSHKSVFILGILIGGFLSRTDWISPGVKRLGDLVRGYEYDSREDCVVMRDKNGDEWCRAAVNCSMCTDVKEIEIIQVCSCCGKLRCYSLLHLTA